MRVFVMAFLAVLSVLFPWSLRAACAFTAERQGSAAVSGIEKVVIHVAASDLRVTGSANQTQVIASGTACASSQKLLDGIALHVRREGSVVHVEAIEPNVSGFNLLRGPIASLDVRIELPDNLPVEVKDSSGDGKLRGLKSLKLVDGSGDLTITDIAGPVDVRVSSGDLHIENAGEVTLKNSSGDMRVRHLSGNLDVDSNSSGDLFISDVGGNVHIGNNSSGDIHIETVRGSVQVDSNSSGDVTVSDIKGSFTVLSNSSGDINFNNVAGNVKVPRDD